MSLKAKITLLLAIISLFMFSGFVSADSPNFEILKIEVNDLLVFESSTGFVLPNLDFERGDQLNVEVTFRGAGNAISGGNVVAEDVTVTAKILGYEFGTISDTSPIQSVDAGVVYKKTLNLVIPEDIDASQFYTLRVEVSDSVDEDQVDFTLNLDEPRHFLNIFDVLINPSATVSAGQPVFVTVRVENLGEKKEEDVKITVSIPSLGVSATNFIEELDTQLQEEEEQFKLGVEAQRQIDLLLRVPEDAQSGTYPVNIDVTYNRGHSTVSTQRSLTVKGVVVEKKVDIISNIDSTSKNVNAGEEVAYRLSFANVGSEKGILSLQVEGVTWGSARVEPGFLTVLPDSTAEATVYIMPNADAQPKDYLSSVKVMLGNELISEMTLRTKVEGAAKVVTGAATFKTVLTIIFAILVIVLIILGLVIAFRRMREEEETEEPAATTTAAGQTYYYYPKR